MKYTARQLGEMIGKSSREINLLLNKAGLLEGKPGDWHPTPRGEELMEWSDHDNGYGGSAARSWAFPKWSIDVLKLIDKQ